MGAVLDQIGCEFAAEEALHHCVAIGLFLDGGVVSEVDVLLEIGVSELAVAYLAGHDVLADEDIVGVVLDDWCFVAQPAAP